MKRLSNARLSFAILTIVYLILIIVLPANRTALQAYNLTSQQYHILLFVVALPLIAVWLAAFEGYARLQRYATSIKNTPEGADFQQLSHGMMWLAWGIPLPSIISIIVNSIANSHGSFHPAATIIINYISLLIPLIAYSLIGGGARGLLQHGRVQLSAMQAKLTVLLFVALGVFFCYITFRHLDLYHAGSTENPYYLPVWLMVLTIIIPYLYAWFVGLLSAYEIVLFGKSTKGLFYRQPSRILAAGVAVVIGASIALQCITSITPRSGHLSLNALLVAVYIIRFGTAGGYLLIASGARRLQRIEEV